MTSRPGAIGPRTLLIILLGSLAAALFLSHSLRKVTVELQRSTPVLGTFATFIVIAPDSGCACRILNSMDSLARHLDNELGFFGSGELSGLNRAGKASLNQMSRHLRTVLNISMDIAEATDSLFDPAMGSISRAWGFPHEPAVPDSLLLDSLLKNSRLMNVEFTGDSVILSTECVMLDLGAVAKGYAADAAFELAMERGASSALVEIGGEIRCGGDGERIWYLAVRDPRGEGMLETLSMVEGALATSGDYESYFTEDGVRYCHILDPRTGRPGNAAASVTVAASTAAAGDALATAISVGGIPLAESLPDSMFRLILILTEDDEGTIREWRREAP